MGRREIETNLKLIFWIKSAAARNARSVNINRAGHPLYQQMPGAAATQVIPIAYQGRLTLISRVKTLLPSLFSATAPPVSTTTFVVSLAYQLG